MWSKDVTALLLGVARLARNGCLYGRALVLQGQPPARDLRDQARQAFRERSRLLQLRVDDLGGCIDMLRQGSAAEVRNKLCVGDAAILKLVCLFHKALDLLPLEGFPKNLPQTLRSDVPSVVLVKPLEGGPQQVVMHGDSVAHHRCQKVRVVDLLVVVGVQGFEDLPRLLVRHVEALHQDLLQLVQCNRALLVLVHGEEVLADLGSLLVRKRPGHHLHTTPSELGVAAKAAQRLHYGAVDFHRLLTRKPLFYPHVLQSSLSRQALLWIDLQQGGDKLPCLRGD
mmetsp:Transcript_47483/g.113963  ORF Transcript_47483/g.113963 Transcript_47483/m.113963 type:complete len:283 (+) Transcript_47483:193-1041(+)